jgi:hypothetical protein
MIRKYVDSDFKLSRCLSTFFGSTSSALSWQIQLRHRLSATIPVMLKIIILKIMTAFIIFKQDILDR